MATTLVDVVSINLVLVGIGLLRSAEEAEHFKNSLDLDLRLEIGIVANAQTGITEPSRTFTVSRERLSLNLSASRSAIAREYPERVDLTRLAQVATQALGSTDLDGQQLQAYGYNIEMVFDQTSDERAFLYIGNRLFGYRPGSEGHWTFEGGAGRLVFSDTVGRRTFALEPRFNDESTSRVFLSLNLHKNDQTIPGQDEIKNSLDSIWSEAEEFMRQLDTRAIS